MTTLTISAERPHNPAAEERYRRGGQVDVDVRHFSDLSKHTETLDRKALGHYS